jgi:hypothetical protein
VPALLDKVCEGFAHVRHLDSQLAELFADATGIGALNYYSTLDATTHAFMERWALRYDFPLRAPCQATGQPEAELPVFLQQSTVARQCCHFQIET